MICYSGKNSYLERIELHSYVLIAIAIHYGQTRPLFMIEEDTYHLVILLCKRSARIYLSVTKSVLQAI